MPCTPLHLLTPPLQEKRRESRKAAPAVTTPLTSLPPPTPRSSCGRYDAVGVRLHAGHQAVALNAIISELPSTHPMLQAAAMNGNTENGRTFLREKLGHTPAQVGGRQRVVAVAWRRAGCPAWEWGRPEHPLDSAAGLVRLWWAVL